MFVAYWDETFIAAPAAVIDSKLVDIRGKQDDIMSPFIHTEGMVHIRAERQQ